MDFEKCRKLEHEILILKQQLIKKESELKELKQKELLLVTPERPLTNDEIARYSRQIILPEITVDGQHKLKQSSFLIVGAGGLGCPALMYLVAAGAGTVGIVDYDIVEKNNLHRQVLHNEDSIGVPKAVSAKYAATKMNSLPNIVTYDCQISSQNALELLSNYQVILDCSDNVATRYLLNDACTIAGKPLISGSALQFEGQLTVYNYNDGPCYRCIFPTPPPPETVTNCGDGGVLGAVTGVIGSLQALEAIKVVLKFGETLSGRLLLFDGVQASFRNVRLRPKRKDCDVCSEKPIITRLINYEQFCGMRASDKDFALFILADEDRATVYEYQEMASKNAPHLLIDVRNPLEFNICHLDNSINIPLKQILQDSSLNEIKDMVQESKIPIFCLCRRGNDSQLAVQHLREKLKKLALVKDIKGGLHAWHYKIDRNFPIY